MTCLNKRDIFELFKQVRVYVDLDQGILILYGTPEKTGKEGKRWESMKVT